MMEVHYNVVKVGDEWMITGQGLRSGHFDTRFEAERVARRMADHASGLVVELHLQNENGGFHSERLGGEAWGRAAAG
jgi:hypothetical protein